MPDEFFISLYILMTYEKHRKLNLRKPSKNCFAIRVSGYKNQFLTEQADRLEFLEGPIKKAPKTVGAFLFTRDFRSKKSAAASF